MNKPSKILMRIFYVILAVCPFALGTILAAFNLIIGWDRLGIEGRDNAFYLLSGFKHPLVGIACFLIILLIGTGLFFLGNMLLGLEKKYFEKKGLEKNKWALVLILLYIAFVTILPRAILLLIYGNSIHPFSDFANAWMNAKTGDYLLEHYKFFPAYLNYAVFERIITVFYREYWVVVLSSIVLNGLTAMGIFLVGKEIKDSKLGLLAALIFALNPSSILYSLIGNPEHLTVCCNVYVVWLMLVAFKLLLSGKGMPGVYGADYFVTDDGAEPVTNWNCWYLPWILVLVAGILAGIGNSMKLFFPIMVVAFVIMIIMFFVGKARSTRDEARSQNRESMVSMKCGKKRESKKTIIAQLFTFIFAMVILISAEYATNQGILKFTENVFDIEESGSDALPHFVLVGLSREGEGQIGKGELSRYFITMRENGVEYEEAKSKAIEAFLNDWSGHESEIFSFLLKKCIWAWQEDDKPHWYFCYCMDLQPDPGAQTVVYDFVEEYGSSIGQLYYFGLMLLGLIGAVILIKKNGVLKAEGLVSLALMLSNLMIVGFFCLILLSEAQSRYKHLILPFICLMAGCGVMMIVERQKVDSGR